MFSYRKSDQNKDVPAFTCELTDDKAIITLVSAGKCELVSAWANLLPQAAGALSEAYAAAEDNRQTEDGLPCVVIAEDHIALQAAYLAGMHPDSAQAFSIPPVTNLALDLKPIGRIDEDSFHLKSTWVRPGGQPAKVEMQGAFIKSSSGIARVPEPLFSLYKACKLLAEPCEKAERFRYLAQLRSVWPEDASLAIMSDAYLRDMRIHYASSLSLKLRILTPEHTDFDPVLFGPRVVEQLDSEGRAPDEDMDSILAPKAQKLFAEDRFRREATARPVYVLRDGEYVFIAPELRPILDAVRKIQDKPESERRAFILNPRKKLREFLGEDKATHVDLEKLFIETEQFSERVSGVDIWRTTVLPWMMPLGKNKWLPEKFGLKIDEEYYTISPENVSTALEKVNTAHAAGKDTVDITGLLEPTGDTEAPTPQLIPANGQTIAALTELKPIADALKEQENAQSEAPSAELVEKLKDKIFLVVRENFEEVEFSPLFAGANKDGAKEEIKFPNQVTTPPKPHQIDGLKWLASCAGTGRHGALLADDMGLGKTLQAIAFMSWLQSEANAGRRKTAPFLIVAPTGLLSNWKDEISKHLSSPALGKLICAFGGDLKWLREDIGFNARDIETGRASLDAENWRDAGVVLTTYETLRDYHFSFARTRFGLVIYDEIQKLKNPVSQMTRACKTLNAAFTLGMTGTPVENRLQDLWSIMDVISPSLLGSSRDFEKRYPATDQAALTKLKTILMDTEAGKQPYMLRRMKVEELEGLPNKKIIPYEVEMPPVQAKAYKDLVLRAAAGVASGSLGKGGMLQILAHMRGISLHPRDPEQAPSDLKLYAKESARLSKTLDVLEKIQSKNEKALIFLEDRAMQERLASLIQSHFKMPKPPMRINGDVPGHKRQELVKAFQIVPDKFDVMILSPKAGGVGLTLTTANHVIHLSRWWNPAVEDQATDRVFRIGQSKDVFVHIPLAVHPDPAIRESSFDLRLNALIERKRKLTQNLFMPGEASEDDLSNLLYEVSQTRGLGDILPTESQKDTKGTNASETAPALPPAAESKPKLVLNRELQNAGVRFWLIKSGQSRPLDDVVSLFADKDVKHIVIRDPYALRSPSARDSQVKFLSLLKSKCRSLSAITIQYMPDDVGDDAQDRRTFNQIFARSFGVNPPPLQLSARKRGDRHGDFHDRFIEIYIVGAGGAPHKHLLNIGRGLEALFDTRYECTLVYQPPSL